MVAGEADAEVEGADVGPPAFREEERLAGGDEGARGGPKRGAKVTKPRPGRLPPDSLVLGRITDPVCLAGTSRSRWAR